jgi:hypothetical protein
VLRRRESWKAEDPDDSEDGAREAFREAVERRVKLQEPDFDGRPVSLGPVRTREGRTNYLLCFERLDGAETPDPWWRTQHATSGGDRGVEHRRLDSRGRVLEGEWRTFVHGPDASHRVVPAYAGGHEVIRMSFSVVCW